ALARRPHDLEQRRRRVLALQSPQGQPDAGRVEDVALAAAVPADGATPAPQGPAVSAHLPARQLARLSLWGYRARSVRAREPRLPSRSDAPADARIRFDPVRTSPSPSTQAGAALRLSDFSASGERWPANRK